jgi:hypothetical protein
MFSKPNQHHNAAPLSVNMISRTKLSNPGHFLPRRFWNRGQNLIVLGEVGIATIARGV